VMPRLCPSGAGHTAEEACGCHVALTWLCTCSQQGHFRLSSDMEGSLGEKQLSLPAKHFLARATQYVCCGWKITLAPGHYLGLFCMDRTSSVEPSVAHTSGSREQGPDPGYSRIFWGVDCYLGPGLRLCFVLYVYITDIELWALPGLGRLLYH
jgi:hypothetical protein